MMSLPVQRERDDRGLDRSGIHEADLVDGVEDRG